jgi:ribosomal protein S18 acetylase RimI-like enzyme
MKTGANKTHLRSESGKISVRKATLDDADAILDCLAVAFAPFRDQYTPEGYRDTTLTPETVRQRLQTMALFVAESATGEIVGTIGGSVHSDTGHLRGMAVLPEWQGRGVADELLQAVEAELQAKGCSHVTLNTTRPLERAVRFYEKHGYQATGKVKDFFGMPLFEYLKQLR